MCIPPCNVYRSDLNFFPTRRSSDLQVPGAAALQHRQRGERSPPRRERGAAGGHLDLPRRHADRSEEHTSELQSPCNIVCRLLLEKKITNFTYIYSVNTSADRR